MVRRLIPEEPDPVRDPEPARFGFELGAIRPVAGEGELDVRMRIAEPGEGFQQDRNSLHAGEPPGEQQAATGAAVGTLGELHGIDTAMDDVHPVPAVDRCPDQHLAAAEVADAGDEERARELGVEAPPFRGIEDVGTVLRDAEREAAELGGEHRDGPARAGEVIVQVDQTALAHALGDDAGLGEVGELTKERRGAWRAGAPGQPQRAQPAIGRAREQAGMRAQQPADRRRQHDERGRCLLALRVVDGLARVGEAADAERLDVEAEAPQGRHLPVNEDERGEPQVFPGHVGDPRPAPRGGVRDRAERATGARHSAAWAATAARSGRSWSSPGRWSWSCPTWSRAHTRRDRHGHDSHR